MSATLTAALYFAAALGLGRCQSCPKCGDYTCDEWIEWDSKYTCSELEQDYGCNCSGCKRCGGPGPAPAPDPSSAKLVMLSETRFPDARCLDGSMSGYYVRQGSVNKYLLFFQGGGWCYDQQCSSPTRAGTIKDCKSRSQQRLGSSKYWSSTESGSYLTGMLSADAAENPVFHNWNLVYLPYCDGASWNGNTTVDGLHFKGKAILDAIVENLQATTSIQKAEQVVISGGSAGASAVFYHADTLSQNLRLEGGEVVALPDAGFFLDLKDKDGINCWPGQMRSLFDVAGYDSLHSGCLARYPNEKWRCMFPQYYADLISTRMLSIMSLYDSSELWYTLRLDCTAAPSSSYPTCSGKEKQDFEQLREEHIKAWAPLMQKKGNGVWAPACITHTSTWDHWTDQSWEVPANSGNTMAAVVARWLSKDASKQVFDFQDAASWPNNAPCSGSDLGKSQAKQAIFTV